MEVIEPDAIPALAELRALNGDLLLIDRLPFFSEKRQPWLKQ